MSKLEDIVPPLELCRRIPAGRFEESALAWGRDVNEGEFFVYPREDIIDIVSPAPTLAEILAKLPAAINGVGVLELALDDRAENNAGRYVICYNRYGVDSALEETTQLESDNNPATAALRVWLRIRQEAGR